MTAITSIPWTDSTWNPWIGCTKISAGCANCYAERMGHRLGWPAWGKDTQRRRTSAANWHNLKLWNVKPFYECPTCGWRGEDKSHDCGAKLLRARRRVFIGSVCDIFEERVDLLPWLRDALHMISNCRELDILLLTKRPNAAMMRIAAATGEDPRRWFMDAVHVALGVTVENSDALWRIDELLAIPAHMRFISCEPLLGPIDLKLSRQEGCNPTCLHHVTHPCENCGYQAGRLPLDWVIVGGESGPGARPMNPLWAYEILDQCRDARTAFFFKQMAGTTREKRTAIPPDLLVREFPGWLGIDNQ